MNKPKRLVFILCAWLAALEAIAGPGSGPPNFAPPTLDISQTGSQITVTWFQPNYYLESAYQVMGPWFPVPGAGSGYTLASSEAQQYFRLTSRNSNPSLSPTAANYSFSILHDQSLAIQAPGVLQFDSDPSSFLLTPIVASSPNAGTAWIAPDGSLFYTPPPHFVGTATFYYIVTDGVNVSAPGVITVAVTNSAPVAVNDQYGVAENSFISVSAPGLLANDFDPDGDTISVVSPPTSGPANGTLSLNADGSFTYVPNANYSGPDSFNYTITDGVTEGNVATVTLNVHAGTAQPPPVAGNDSFSTAHDQNLYVPAPGILQQCSDPNHDPLSAVLVSGVGNGILSLYADGSFTYLPNAGFVGEDSFTYQAADSTTNSVVATVTIAVTNAAPVANDDNYTTLPGQTLTVNDTGVLVNDTDAENDPLTVQLVTGPANGTLTLSSNGGFVYTPNPVFVGVDSFTYTASDGFASSGAATVSIDVTNPAPIGVDDNYGAQENLALTVPAPGVLRNDSDADNDTLSAQLLTSPASGSLTFETNGAFVYQPSANFTGTDTFTYEAEDGTVASAPVTVTITVHSTNTAPVAVPDTYVVLPGEVLSIDTYNGVLANDTDAEGDELSATLVTGPTNAFDFGLNSDGTFTYVPNVGFVGVDTFSYEAFDGLAYSAPTTVTISVTNGGPAPVTLSYSTHVNTPLSVLQPGVLGGVEDQDDSPLTATPATAPGHGTVTLMADGSFTYTPNTGFLGNDSFMFQVFDGTVASAPARVFIAVTNSAPVAYPDDYITRENEAVTGADSVLTNDVDADHDPLTASLVSSPTHSSSFNFNADGTFTYAPRNGFIGSDTFTYRASDGIAQSAVTTVTITVGNTPIAVDDYYIYTPGQPLIVPAANGVLQNDFDATDPGLTAQLVGAPAGVALNPDGSFTFLTPPSYSSMPITFQYVAILNNVTSAPATVHLVSALLAAGPPAAPPPPPPPALELISVAFTGGNDLLPDDGGPAAAPFKAPQWLDNNGDGTIDTTKGDHTFPYSYVAGQTMTAEPVFTVNDNTVLFAKSLQIRGVLYDKNNALGITIPCKVVVGGFFFRTLTVQPSVADTAFSKAANFYNPLTIKWQFSTDGLAANNAKKVWQSCGTSKNQLYVTLAAPATSLKYQTVVEIGCREGAGLTDSAKMLTNIWRYFSKIKVQRASDGKPMYYYRNWAVGNTTVATLLKDLDGQCASWCDTFKASLENQGIAGAAIINVESVKKGEDFLVKNWTFGAMKATNPLNGQRTPKYPYINIPRNDPDGSPSYLPATGQNYLWWSSVVKTKGMPDVTYAPEVNDAVDGVPGENNPRPAKFFIRHFVVSVNNQYYDPSYGLTYANSQDLYMKAIAGFAVGQNAPYNGSINDGSAVVAYNNVLAIFLIRKALPGGPDQLKTAEIDQKLAYIQQPTNTKQKTAITPAVQVQVQDWNDNPIKVAGTVVNISLYNIAGAGADPVTGATATTDANGIAIFTTLQVNMPVTKCALLAQSTAAVSVVSVAFKITP